MTHRPWVVVHRQVYQWVSQRNNGGRWPASLVYDQPCHSDRREESQRCTVPFVAHQRDASHPFSMTVFDIAHYEEPCHSDHREESQRCAMQVTVHQRNASPPFSMTLPDAAQQG